MKKLTRSLALLGLSTHLVGMAQTPPTTQSLGRVEITGSSIKRIASEGALPVQIITAEDIKRQGIVNAEQLLSTLSDAGNGLNNLASNSDVANGSGRASNGLSGANLRGQGANNTLVLLNGRRLAAHGLDGGTVDLNQIPMAAIQRVEILKDGASAIYGTDAIGGVINFILKKNYQGFEVSAFTDVTQQGGGNVSRVSLTGGAGDLESDKYNVLFALTRSQNQALFGNQRSFVNDFQSSRGLSPDTTGAPFATLQTLSTLNSVLSNKSSTGPVAATGGVAQRYINVLNLPGGAGCNSVSGMAPYDYALWGNANYKYACTTDTGVAATLQQPVDNTNLVARGTLQLGEHQLFAEVTAAKVTSSKVFSPSQLSSSTTAKIGTAPNQIDNPLYNMAYPLNAVNKTTYDSVFNQLVGTFPTVASNYGLPLAFKWRCMPCGSRQYDTTSETSRVMVGAEGPLSWLSEWDYRAGISTANSSTTSVLGNGYYFGVPLVNAIATGGLNPFLPAGQSQSSAALAALAAASANGTTLYGGKFTLVQADATASGPIFKLPAGNVMAAVGVDIRREQFAFNGNAGDWATQLAIPNAAFDSINTMDTVQRDVKAIFTEVLVPITKELEATVAVRRDEYTGFGSTTNPKVSMRFAPAEDFMVRGSYNTGFKVPDFKQQFFGVTEAPGGSTTVDPATCPTLKVSALPGCQSIVFNTLFGGNPALQPEKSKQSTLGFVWAPTRSSNIGVDWWTINRTGTIQAAPLATLLSNYTLFPQNFNRDASGNIVQIDTRWINAGETITSGVDITANVFGKMGDARWAVNLDGSYVYEKLSRPIASAPFGANEVGLFNPSSTTTGELALRWKHALTGTYTRGPWTGSLTQLYRSGYKQNVIYASSFTPTDFVADVDSYKLYNASVTYSGIKNLDLTFGIKNLLNTDPPFAITYDTNTGAGSSWDPRVADPRGRSYTLQANYKF